MDNGEWWWDPLGARTGVALGLIDAVVLVWWGRKTYRWLRARKNPRETV